MKSLLSNQYLLLISRLILGFVFVFTGIEKAADPASFSQAIGNYKLLPEFLTNFAAVTLPWIELAAGMLLLFGVRIKENSLILGTLLVIFIIAVGISAARGLDISCGCFGTGSGQQVGLAKIAENAVLLLLGIQLFFFETKRFLLKN